MYLHGTLEATILDAKVQTSPSSSSSCMGLCLKNSKPAYVTIKLGGAKVVETTHEHDRAWNQTFRILCAHPADATVSVKLRTTASVMAKVRLPASALLEYGGDRKAPVVDESLFPLLARNGSSDGDRELLRFRLRFVRAESEPSWGRGVGTSGGFRGLVHGVSFLQRPNCDVVLYQDAHHHRSFRPPFRAHSGAAYRPRRLWEDLFSAIDGARHLVYIAGWSLNPKLVLIRDPDTELQHGRGVTIGELLKRKAEEGVAVRLMLWNDETSLPVIRNAGVMRTHDEDALQYFRHTKVICRLCPRLHHDFPTFFAHHQKTVTVDVPAGDRRALASFIGGLDLCDGRYDTEDHSLFRTLNAEAHAGDFYQINVAGASLRRGGPREPWHDVHARVVGPAARDVLANFEQRWLKQCGDASLLVPANLVSDGVPGHDGVVPAGDGWSVQVFRSIDGISVHMGSDDVEHSIHDAYVAAIRRAERFIYIENQYFMGSCQLWPGDRHSGCRNLIPAEIALKVSSKIRAGEPFAAYVVIPMWPEGVPESETVQEMLHWTRLTMATMYKIIGDAIRDCHLAGDGHVPPRAHPRDYLNFFCLANREARLPGEYVPPSSPPCRAAGYRASQRNRRFMVYVHSKLMIVDDEYLLIGSANVNQRSMDGRRDTEIAVGCYQPDRGRSGEVHDFRMSLWYEHTGRVEEEFLSPESIGCVRKVRRIGEEMWRVYAGEEVVDMGGVHLVSYPVEVGEDGRVGEVGIGVFPDTSASVRGRRSLVIPPLCTT